MNKKIVLEIGLNHLGDEKYFLQYINAAIKNNAKYVTIQIREPGFYQNGKDNLLNSDNVKKNLLKLKKYKVKVGLSICDMTFKNYLSGFKPDFFKILSWEADNLELIKNINSFKKPIYISLGMLNSKRIFTLTKKLKRLKGQFNLIHTQLNYKKNDLNLNFINTLKNKTLFPISYGHHMKNDHLPIIIANALSIDKIFLYFKISRNRKHNDEAHAFYLSEINKISNILDQSKIYMGNSIKTKTANMIELFIQN